MTSSALYDTKLEVHPAQSSGGKVDAEGDAVVDEKVPYEIWANVSANVGPNKEEFIATEERPQAHLIVKTPFDEELWSDLNTLHTKIMFDGFMAEVFRPALLPSPARAREIRFDLQYSLEDNG